MPDCRGRRTVAARGPTCPDLACVETWRGCSSCAAAEVVLLVRPATAAASLVLNLTNRGHEVFNTCLVLALTLVLHEPAVGAYLVHVGRWIIS